MLYDDDYRRHQRRRRIRRTMIRTTITRAQINGMSYGQKKRQRTIDNWTTTTHISYIIIYKFTPSSHQMYTITTILTLLYTQTNIIVITPTWNKRLFVVFHTNTYCVVGHSLSFATCSFVLYEFCVKILDALKHPHLHESSFSNQLASI